MTLLASDASADLGASVEPRRPAAIDAGDARLREILDAHYAFIWRQMRRLGVPEDRAEDAALQVFLVASKRLGDIKPGSERSFLFGIGLRLASEFRRKVGPQREMLDDELRELADTQPLADELLDQHRARRALDAILDSMPDAIRAVFVLYELEELTMIEIAHLLDLPPGTVASRLRRGRDAFEAAVRRLKARRSPGAIR